MVVTWLAAAEVPTAGEGALRQRLSKLAGEAPSSSTIMWVADSTLCTSTPAHEAASLPQPTEASVNLFVTFVTMNMSFN